LNFILILANGCATAHAGHTQRLKTSGLKY